MNKFTECVFYIEVVNFLLAILTRKHDFERVANQKIKNRIEYQHTKQSIEGDLWIVVLLKYVITVYGRIEEKLQKIIFYFKIKVKFVDLGAQSLPHFHKKTK